jgi:hypothetical protein
MARKRGAQTRKNEKSLHVISSPYTIRNPGIGPLVCASYGSTALNTRTLPPEQACLTDAGMVLADPVPDLPGLGFVASDSS